MHDVEGCHGVVGGREMAVLAADAAAGGAFDLVTPKERHGLALKQGHHEEHGRVGGHDGDGHNDQHLVRPVLRRDDSQEGETAGNPEDRRRDDKEQLGEEPAPRRLGEEHLSFLILGFVDIGAQTISHQAKGKTRKDRV